jgi:hypothetical protein
MPRIEIAEEIVPKRAFAWAVEWPGWCRGGKTPLLAREALIAAAPRYAEVARAAGLVLPELTDADLHVVDTVDGGSGTEFGVPSAIVALDRLPTSAAEAERLAALVGAAWTVFDAVAAAAPATLRKGPRGGGRDRDRMIDHAIEADHAYALEIGVRHRPPDPMDRVAVGAERASMLDVLGEPSDGSPLAGRRWTARYAARRIAWHALDHAWEMQDRSETNA